MAQARGETRMGGPSMVNEERQKVRVLAVDPAPGKGSTVFDGTAFSMKTGSELRTYLNEPGNRTRGTLVCWDAPLTGPTNPASAGACPVDFTQRLIEQFFSRAETGFKTPRGISVMPYSGCSHWTISRSLLGLPRTGPFDYDYHQLPFHLLPPGPDSECRGRASIIEIHPGVAAWLWCKDAKDGRWEYKKDVGILREMWSILLARTRFRWTDRPTPENHDEFDAAVGYLLGSLYVGDRSGVPEVEHEVTILGDRSTGSFLLPAVPDLAQRWDAWLRRPQPSMRPGQISPGNTGPTTPCSTPRRSFNEARADQPGKSRRPVRSPRPLTGFNEARADQPGKFPGGFAPVRVFGIASMRPGQISPGNQ